MSPTGTNGPDYGSDPDSRRRSTRRRSWTSSVGSLSLCARSVLSCRVDAGEADEQSLKTDVEKTAEKKLV